MRQTLNHSYKVSPADGAAFQRAISVWIAHWTRIAFSRFFINGSVEHMHERPPQISNTFYTLPPTIVGFSPYIDVCKQIFSPARLPHFSAIQFFFCRGRIRLYVESIIEPKCWILIILEQMLLQLWGGLWLYRSLLRNTDTLRQRISA